MFRPIIRNDTPFHGKELTMNLHQALKETFKSDDFLQSSVKVRQQLVHLSYFKTIVNHEALHHDILKPIQKFNGDIDRLDRIRGLLPLDEVVDSDNVEEIKERLIKGSIYIQLATNLNEGLIIDLANKQLGHRTFNDSENEFSVIGPKVGFVEDIDTNINLLRKIIVTEKLTFEEHIIGSVSKTRVAIAYLEGLTNPQHVNTARQRLLDLDIDVVYDSSFLDQIVSDNSNTPFPLLLSSERIDRVTYCLTSGQVAILSDGSSYALSGPCSLFDFFISPEDYYLPWILGSFLRIIRYIGIAFSVFLTPLYVAVLTYHVAIIRKVCWARLSNPGNTWPVLPDTGSPLPGNHAGVVTRSRGEIAHEGRQYARNRRRHRARLGGGPGCPNE